jgi:hypothetical protein
MAVDFLADRLGLLFGQQASRAQRSATALAGQSVQSVGGVGAVPAADGFMSDSQKFGKVHFGVTQFDATQGAQPQNLKRFIGQLASVRQFDSHDESPSKV